MVFQNYALYPHMTVAENMAFGLRLAGFSKEHMDAAVKRAAQILQIEPLLDRRPKTLSGGQRQRVAIGRAIVRKPGVFLFDEPLSNLDAALRVQMRLELTQLHAELKTTMVYVTHDQTEAMTLANRIVVLNQGRIEQVGSPLDLYHRPANLFVAGFIGSPKMNFLDCTLVSSDVTGTTVHLPGGTDLKVDADARGLKPGDALTLGIRSEHLLAQSAPGENSVPAKVRMAEHLGDRTFLYVELPGTPGNLTVSALPTNPLTQGQEAFLTFLPHRCYLFDAAGRTLPALPQA
jgi:multiple sugar transport system ATP-binding protein